jgi:hypothetical protein
MPERNASSLRSWSMFYGYCIPHFGNLEISTRMLKTHAWSIPACL